MKTYISIGKAAKILGKTEQTLRNWDRDGVFVAERTPKGHRIYDMERVSNFQFQEEKKKEKSNVFLYGRVSTKKQMESGNLDRQLQRLTMFAVENNYKIIGIYQDVASGLNEKRKGLEKLLKECKEKKPNLILIEYKDRLARFGFSYLENHLHDLNIHIQCIEEKEKNEETELVEDLIAITTSFSARIYGKRGGKKIDKDIKKILKGASSDENDKDSPCEGSDQ